MPPKSLNELFEQTKEEYCSIVSNIEAEHQLIDSDLKNIEKPVEKAKKEAEMAEEEFEKAKLRLEKAKKEADMLENEKEKLLGRKREFKREEFVRFMPQRETLVEKVLEEESAGWCKGIIDITTKQLICSVCKETPLDPRKIRKVCKRNHAECAKCKVDSKICGLCLELKVHDKWEEGLNLQNTIEMLTDVMGEVKSNSLKRQRKG